MNYTERYSYGSDSSGVDRVLTSIDRFDLIDQYLMSLIETKAHTRPKYFNMVISIYGEIWTKEHDPIDIDLMRLERNRTIENIYNVSDLTKITPIRDFIYNEQAKNEGFGLLLMKEIGLYGLVELYPEFFGVEVGVVVSAGTLFCQCNSLIRVKGPDAETFRNVRKLIL